METIGISCSCGNTEGFKLSQTAVECTSCSTLHTITDEPIFITRSIKPLHDIMEQRAKDKAFEDMYQDVDMYADIPYIDWSTCFDINNIREVNA